LLFVSKDAKLDGSKAIRGGIPLVFPQFGQPDTSMPQHGFLRNNVWTVNESSKYDSDQAAGVSLDLKLSEVVNARGGKWAEGTDLDCELVLNIKVQPNALTTTLTIKNTGTKSFDFQTLFHTYYLVADHQALNKEHCNVKGLEGYSCDDKITGESYIQGSDPIVIDGEVDRVYNPPADKPAVEIVIQTGSGTFAQLKASGFVDGKEVLASCVVWK
jgi:glucose-6-phosphate 1-epimerase